MYSSHLTDVSQSARQTISKRREMASWKLTGPGSPMAWRATQMTKLPLPTKSRPFVTLQLGLQNITVYLTNFMKKTTDPADCLRRMSCVNQLAGKTNSETAEQFNNRRNRDNYFTTSLTAHNSVFVERLATHFNNEKINRWVMISHSRQVNIYLCKKYTLRKNVQHDKEATNVM